MGDVAKVLLAISRGDFDTQLGDIADALTIRLSVIEDYQLAAAVTGAYAERTGISVKDLLEGTDADVS